MRRTRHAHDSGFTLIEVLVVVIIIGILSAIAIPVFAGQKSKAANSNIQADLKNYARAADQFFTNQFFYPSDPSGFSLRGTETGVPTTSNDTAYRAFTVKDGVNAGYVIFGSATTTGTVFVISSYDEKPPQRTTLTALPEVPPTAGTYGVPGNVGPNSWIAPQGAQWGAATILGSAGDTLPIFDQKLQTLKQDGGTTGDIGNFRRYTSVGGTNPTLRTVESASPVATRAIEVTKSDLATTQGIWITQQEGAGASAWAKSRPVAAGEVFTVSAWVKSTSKVTIVARTVTSAPGWVGTGVAGKVSSGSGKWERLTATFTVPANATPQYVSVFVLGGSGVPAGGKFEVAGPQINVGPVASPFRVTPVP